MARGKFDRVKCAKVTAVIVCCSFAADVEGRIYIYIRVLGVYIYNWWKADRVCGCGRSRALCLRERERERVRSPVKFQIASKDAFVMRFFFAWAVQCAAVSRAASEYWPLLLHAATANCRSCHGIFRSAERRVRCNGSWRLSFLVCGRIYAYRIYTREMHLSRLDPYYTACGGWDFFFFRYTFAGRIDIILLGGAFGFFFRLLWKKRFIFIVVFLMK